ncbi:glycosyltransferase family 4 protein [Oceanobacillus sp. FSL K6-0127]|uniref:glycosyltransferase family 4 protein n=1 Tax=Oceanobacillus sp. FSL K6-0127 TaxID=2921420 RepID=UPI0030ECBC6E
MIKVLYIVSTLANTGPTNQLFNIVTNLDKDTFNPIILTLSPESEDSQLERFINANIEVDSLNLSRFKGMLKGSHYLRRKVEELDPTLVHTQGLRADTLAARNLKQYKKVTTLRNYPFHDYPMKFGKVKGLIMAYSHIKAFKYFDSPITCSESLASLLETKIKERYKFIQNGVDINHYTFPTFENKESMRKKIKIPLNKKVFITVGSLISRKDPLTVIKAFIQSKAFDNSILLIIGDGPLKKECQEVAKDYTNIIFTGQVEDVKDYLTASDYFVSASLSEGLPNTVLEALSVGLPCCLSNIEQHREILKLNKNAGILIETKSISEFAQSFSFIQEKDYNLVTSSARNIIIDHLSANIMSRKYQDLYKKLVISD